MLTFLTCPKCGYQADELAFGLYLSYVCFCPECWELFELGPLQREETSVDDRWEDEGGSFRD